MGERLFGTDGIRGLANTFPMTAEMALRIGRAAAATFRKEERQHTFLVGKDTRRSGYMFENALTAGLSSMGVNVLLTGPLPTPGVSYIMRSLRCDAAIMISASHNSYPYNGIKFFGPDGYKLPDELEDAIERQITSGEVDSLAVPNDEIGRARRIDDAVGRYIEFAKSSFPKGMRLDGFRIVVDCAHGAAYKVGPATFSELGAEVIAIGDKPDGRNINEKCGSMHPDEMRALVIRERADLGIAFDGDADRIVMSDEEGRLLDGNALLTILGIDLLERDMLPQKTVATTVMANGGMESALREYGGKVVWTKVGDRYVVEQMRENGYSLGGESSGHIVMFEHNTTGDALIAGLQLLACMIRKGQPLSVLANAYRAMPESHRTVPLNGASNRPTGEQLDGIRKEAEQLLGTSGRAVIRPSGTEPIIRVMVQHHHLKDAETLCNQLAERIKSLSAK